MKNIYSNIFKFNKKILKKTIKFLKKNKIVGLPTETVYGLAGNAYSKIAVNKIYKLKKRPSFNPLIIHYYGINDINKDVNITSDFIKLYKKLCPGPITFVLKKKKKSKISSLALAKLNTVAVRFPSHPVMRKLLKFLPFPLAAPSANISSRISPTSSYDVAEEFKKDIKIIIDGGNSKVGIESTVIDLTKKIKILRPGIITKKNIKKILKKNISIPKKLISIKAPGSLKKHYSPGIPIILNSKSPFKKHAFISFGNKFRKAKNSFSLSSTSNLKIAAKNLYKILRKIKKLKYKKIYISKIPNHGIGIALNDRIKRAAQK